MTLKLPAGVLAQHVIALGKTGAGKSSAMRVLVEGLLDQDKPVCIIDPKGDWWGIKSSADGKKAGYPIVIFGGDHADVPINEHSGPAVAELIATGNRSCLIDLGGWMVGERTRFFVAFASNLFKFTRGARHLVIDEVHNFAPQGKILDPDAGKMLHWANRLASEGRGKGITILAASQRPQKVHKDFVTSCETLIAMRVIHKLDRESIKDWIDGCADATKGKEVITTLAQMKRGEAWVWSPEIEYGPERVTFPMFKTYDSFKPQAENVGKLAGWAAVDLDQVKTKLATVVKDAEANDPAMLKKRIALLEKELKAKAPAPVDESRIRSLEDRAYDKGYKSATVAISAMVSAVIKAGDEFMVQLRGVTKAIDRSDPEPSSRPSATVVPHKPANSRAIARHKPSPAAAADPRLSRPQQLILDKLSVLAGRDIYPASRATLAAFCRVSPSSSGYEKNLSTLKTLGLIEYPRQGEVGFTPEGEAAAAPPSDDGTPSEEFWLSIVNEPKARILRALIDEHPKAMSRGAIAQAADVSQSSSGFEKNLSQLKTLGAIEYPMSGVVSLSRYVIP